MSVSEKATHLLTRISRCVSINKRIRGNVLPGSGATGAPVIDRHRDEASSASGKCILDGKFGHAYNSSELRMCLCA